MSDLSLCRCEMLCGDKFRTFKPNHQKEESELFKKNFFLRMRSGCFEVQMSHPAPAFAFTLCITCTVKFGLLPLLYLLHNSPEVITVHPAGNHHSWQNMRMRHHLRILVYAISRRLWTPLSATFHGFYPVLSLASKSCLAHSFSSCYREGFVVEWPPKRNIVFVVKKKETRRLCCNWDKFCHPWVNLQRFQYTNLTWER